jgi:uncharacterized membrane protein HdeD (DUF308 family)
MNNSLTKNWWLLLLAGLAYAAMGVIVWAYPGETVLGVTLYLGISMLIAGFSLIGIGWNLEEQKGSYIAGGIIDIVIASLILFFPVASASVLILSIGLWIIFKGVLLIAESFGLRKLGFKSWWINLIGGIAIIIFGWYMARNPMAGTFALVSLVSLNLWIKAFVYITDAFGLRSLGKLEKEIAA